ncbi:uncharacterized protein [Diabrotica undecimpunctata]|uniref:uncharacterized protein n=1 Tax=Diabrotica undecimpunctata TaxID=50387 RepID=UPI003B63DDA8
MKSDESHQNYEANEKIEKLEREKKRKNVVIQGLNIDTNDQKLLREAVENFLKKELQVSVDVNGARKIGENTTLVELNSVKNKIEVMKNKNKLKNKTDERIYINDDMSKEEIIIQKEIRSKATAERYNGKNVKIGFQKLIIDGEICTWNNSQRQLVKDKNVKPKN